jgi:hypothetical protein
VAHVTYVHVRPVREAPQKYEVDLSQEVHDACQGVRSADGPTLADALNHFIARFVGPSFAASAAVLEDEDGTRTEAYSTVVHADQGEPGGAGVGEVSSDHAAAAMCAVETLDVENLRAAYNRLAQAKRLRKRPVPRGMAHTNRTLTIILAQQSAGPLETVALEVERLNAQTPNAQWPDMVTVASTGAVQYAVQFPGEGLSGDFLPPAEGALQAYTPPMYVVIVLRPSGERTLNRMLACLLAHLGIFSPGAPLPRWDEVLSGCVEECRDGDGLPVRSKWRTGAGAATLLQRSVHRARATADRIRTGERSINRAAPAMAGRGRDPDARQVAAGGAARVLRRAGHEARREGPATRARDLVRPPDHARGVRGNAAEIPAAVEHGPAHAGGGLGRPEGRR